MAVRLENDNLIITITASAIARFVELKLDGVDAVFSDNYFDVPPCQAVSVICPMPQDWTLADVEKALKVYSLYDSF